MYSLVRFLSFISNLWHHLNFFRLCKKQNRILNYLLDLVKTEKRQKSRVINWEMKKKYCENLHQNTLNDTYREGNDKNLQLHRSTGAEKDVIWLNWYKQCFWSFIFGEKKIIVCFEIVPVKSRQKKSFVNWSHCVEFVSAMFSLKNKRSVLITV